MFGAQKKCEKCGKPALYKFTKFINGKPVDRFYCEDHAAESSNYVQKQSTETIKELLKSVVEGMGESAAVAKEFPDVRCHACGLSFEAYKRTLLLGCPDCYRSFEELMLGELRKFHGETRHVGHAPASGASQKSVDATPAYSKEEPELFEEEDLPDLDEESPVEPEAEVSLDEMRRRLKESVAREDFAEAARLRDQIKSYEQKHAK